MIWGPTVIKNHDLWSKHYENSWLLIQKTWNVMKFHIYIICPSLSQWDIPIYIPLHLPMGPFLTKCYEHVNMLLNKTHKSADPCRRRARPSLCFIILVLPVLPVFHNINKNNNNYYLVIILIMIKQIITKWINNQNRFLLPAFVWRLA